MDRDLDNGGRGAPLAALALGLKEQPDAALQAAHRLYHQQQPLIGPRLAAAQRRLQHYDVEGMRRAASICFWGRSGSWLLQSYLDGHEDLLILPRDAGHLLYPFFLEFPHLSLWGRLLAYPLYSELRTGPNGALFSGDSPVCAADYYAAVHALHERYQSKAAHWLASRRCFVQCLHVAYGIATGRPPGSSRPLIVYCQHWLKEDLARPFIEDFPDGRFIHTVRDPISAVDSWYEHQIEMQTFLFEHKPELAGRYLGRISAHYLDPSGQAMRSLLRTDRAHLGMEARTRAVRFEDLHLCPEATMRRLAEWLGIAYRPCLIESTFNGAPYVHRTATSSWIGANPHNAKRRSRNLSASDRCLLYALLYENFASWNYPVPPAFRWRPVRAATIAALLLLPMKMELLNVQLVWQRQLVPALKHKRIIFGSGAPVYVLLRRAVMMAFVAWQALRRAGRWRQSLQPL